MLYFKIDATDQLTILDVISGDLKDPVTKAVSVINGKPFYVEVTVTDPAYDNVTQIKEGPVDTYDGTTATRIFTVRSKTTQELDDDQMVKDIRVLRNATKDSILVLIEFVDWALANTSMQASDFTTNVRQAYQDLKVIADRIK